MKHAIRAENHEGEDNSALDRIHHDLSHCDPPSPVEVENNGRGEMFDKQLSYLSDWLKTLHHERTKCGIFVVPTQTGTSIGVETGIKTSPTRRSTRRKEMIGTKIGILR